MRGLFIIWILLGLTASLAFVPTAEADESSPPSPPLLLTPGLEIKALIWRETCFDFEGKAGEIITIKALGNAPGLDPHVALIDPNNKREAFDDDSGGHGNSLIKDHALRRNGRYTVAVGLAERKNGDVEILLMKSGSSGTSQNGAPSLQTKVPSTRR